MRGSEEEVTLCVHSHMIQLREWGVGAGGVTQRDEYVEKSRDKRHRGRETLPRWIDTLHDLLHHAYYMKPPAISVQTKLTFWCHGSLSDTEGRQRLAHPSQAWLVSHSPALESKGPLPLLTTWATDRFIISLLLWAQLAVYYFQVAVSHGGKGGGLPLLITGCWSKGRGNLTSSFCILFTQPSISCRLTLSFLSSLFPTGSL